jgi:hypothetical protein
MAKKATARKSAKRSSAKRDLVDTGSNKRYVKRTAKGKFKDSDDVSRALSADTRKAAKKATKAGYGDQGDRKRASKKR